MLHAIEKNKSKIYKRYWGEHDSFVPGNITAEDEITSTLLGPLEFMTPSDVCCIIKKFLGDKTLPENLSLAKFKLCFWPGFTKNDGRDIYPDAELIFFLEDVEKPIAAILFELKWNARLSGDDQLHQQWKAFKFKDAPSCSAYHLFIGRSISQAKQKQDNDDIWQGKLICQKWADIQNKLSELENENNSPVGRWATLAGTFLQYALGARPFNGFGMIMPYDSGRSDFATPTAPIFWDDRWFARLDVLLPDDIPLHQPLFFTEKNHDGR